MFLVLIIIGFFWCKKENERNFLWFVTLAFFVYTLFILAVGGDFMQFRFMFQIYPLVMAGSVLGLIEFSKRALVLSTCIVGLAVIFSRGPVYLDPEYHMETLQGMDECCAQPGIIYGKRLKEVLPHDVLISTTMVGAMPFYSRLRTIDQLGLNDREVATQGVLMPKFRRGHLKYASEEYLWRRRVNLVFGHPVVCDCQNPCTETGHINVFIKLGWGQRLRSWYLTTREDLTSYFCSNPQNFIITGTECKKPQQFE